MVIYIQIGRAARAAAECHTVQLGVQQCCRAPKSALDSSGVQGLQGVRPSRMPCSAPGSTALRPLGTAHDARQNCSATGAACIGQAVAGRQTRPSSTPQKQLQWPSQQRHSATSDTTLAAPCPAAGFTPASACLNTHRVNTVMPGWSCRGIWDSAGMRNTPRDITSSSKMCCKASEELYSGDTGAGGSG